MADHIKIDTSQVDNFRRSLQGTPAELKAAQQQATEEAGEYAKRLIERNATSAGISKRGGALWLRGVGGSGAPIGVDVELTDDKTGFDLKATGPWQLVEGDTKAHEMPGRKRRAKGRPYRTPYGAYSRIRHPGTKGKHIWRKSFGEIRKKYPRYYRDAVVKVLNKR